MCNASHEQLLNSPLTTCSLAKARFCKTKLRSQLCFGEKYFLPDYSRSLDKQNLAEHHGLDSLHKWFSFLSTMHVGLCTFICSAVYWIRDFQGLEEFQEGTETQNDYMRVNVVSGSTPRVHYCDGFLHKLHIIQQCGETHNDSRVVMMNLLWLGLFCLAVFLVRRDATNQPQ